jgi:methionine synthase II (cobalamin-independent)
MPPNLAREFGGIAIVHTAPLKGSRTAQRLRATKVSARVSQDAASNQPGRGLVSSKVSSLELVDEICRRVDDAAKYMDLDRLAISPQCGFASTVARNPVTEATQRDKLRLIVKAWHTVWS